MTAWPHDIVNSAIRSADSENHALEPNMKWIEWAVAEIWPFEIIIISFYSW